MSRVELRARDRTQSLPHVFFMFISTVFYQFSNKLKVDHILYKRGRYVRNRDPCKKPHADRVRAELWRAPG